MKTNTVVVYDVNAKNSKPRRLLKKWLMHQQNSVFSGNLTQGQREQMIDGLKASASGPEETILVFSSEGHINVDAICGAPPATNIL